MSQYCVTKSTLEGHIFAPPSKSHTLRAILFGALGEGRTTIYNYLPSPDAMAMVEACGILGATIDLSPHAINIVGCNGTILKAEDVIDAKNSGIVLRFCAAIGSLASLPIVVTGDASIRRQRPMQPLLEALRQLNVKALSMRGDEHAPVILQGPIRPGTVVMSGEDSQPVSALLIAAGFADGPIEIFVENPGETPWIDLTLSWLDRLGIRYHRKGYTWFQTQGGSRYSGFTYSVPGDFSSAAFPIAAALVTNSALDIHNLDLHDPQGDKELINVFQKMGALFDVDPVEKVLHVQKGAILQGIDIDVNAIIDALPVLAVVACFASGTTRLYNGAIARKKECDRIRSLATELRKMGADIKEEEDGLVITGSPLLGAHVQSHNDHRVAMALTIAGIGASGETCVSSIECVAKTYPSFAKDFNTLGASILCR